MLYKPTPVNGRKAATTAYTASMFHSPPTSVSPSFDSWTSVVTAVSRDTSRCTSVLLYSMGWMSYRSGEVGGPSTYRTCDVGEVAPPSRYPPDDCVLVVLYEITCTCKRFMRFQNHIVSFKIPSEALVFISFHGVVAT